MNEEEVKEIIREETLKTIKSKLNSSMIFTYISNLEQENKQLKEDKKKAREFIKENTERALVNGESQELIDQEDIPIILEILGDKENE